jgi:hypothetical protein
MRIGELQSTSRDLASNLGVVWRVSHFGSGSSEVVAGESYNFRIRVTLFHLDKHNRIAKCVLSRSHNEQEPE